MATEVLAVRMDAELKENFSKTCDDLGLSMSTAVIMLAKKMTREQRLPFEVSKDPFYSESNIRYLKGILNDIDSGKAHFAEHDLIEVD